MPCKAYRFNFDSNTIGPNDFSKFIAQHREHPDEGELDQELDEFIRFLIDKNNEHEIAKNAYYDAKKARTEDKASEEEKRLAQKMKETSPPNFSVNSTGNGVVQSLIWVQKTPDGGDSNELKTLSITQDPGLSIQELREFIVELSPRGVEENCKMQAQASLDPTGGGKKRRKTTRHYKNKRRRASRRRRRPH